MNEDGGGGGLDDDPDGAGTGVDDETDGAGTGVDEDVDGAGTGVDSVEDGAGTGDAAVGDGAGTGVVGVGDGAGTGAGTVPLLTAIVTGADGIPTSPSSSEAIAVRTWVPSATVVVSQASSHAQQVSSKAIPTPSR